MEAIRQECVPRLPAVPTLDQSPQSVDDGRTNRPVTSILQRTRGPASPDARDADTAYAGQGRLQPAWRLSTAWRLRASRRTDRRGAISLTNDPYSNNSHAGTAPGYNTPADGPNSHSDADRQQLYAGIHPNPMNQAGLGGMTNPYSNPSAGAAAKPYNDYQRPNGYSPWQLLNQPTQGGTLNPYTTYVQPARATELQLAHERADQRRADVATLQQFRHARRGGYQGGNGLVNPSIFQSYKPRLLAPFSQRIFGNLQRFAETRWYIEPGLPGTRTALPSWRTCRVARATRRSD